MKKYFILIAALATTMTTVTSCINDEEKTNDAKAPAEIKISASMKGMDVSTRAATDLQGSTLSDYTKAGVFVYKTGQTAAVAASEGVSAYAGYANVTVSGATDPTSGSGKILTTSTTMYFPMDNANVDAYVYAPYSATYNEASVTSMAFTVANDQTSDDNYLASDFVFGKGTAVYASEPALTTDKTASVQLAHALSKIIFKINEQTGADASGITEIKLTGAYRKATINMSTNDVATATGGSDPKGDVIVSNKTGNSDLYDDVKNGSNGVAAIIPPHDATAIASMNVSVTIDGKTRTAAIASANLTQLVKGKVYTLTLNISASELSVLVTGITDWTPGVTENRDLTF